MNSTLGSVVPLAMFKLFFSKIVEFKLVWCQWHGFCCERFCFQIILSIPVTALTGDDVPGNYNVTVAVYSGQWSCWKKMAIVSSLTQKNSLLLLLKFFLIQGDELILLVVPENGSTVEVFLFHSWVEEKTTLIGNISSFFSWHSAHELFFL